MPKKITWCVYQPQRDRAASFLSLGTLPDPAIICPLRPGEELHHYIGEPKVQESHQQINNDLSFPGFVIIAARKHVKAWTAWLTGRFDLAN